MKRLASVLGLVAMLLPMTVPHAFGYAGGPLRNVTDLAPTCAGCHSSFNKDQLRNEPEAFANSQVKENKHYKAIEDGSGPYQQMAPPDRQKLLTDVKLMDELASITLNAPTTLKPGQEAQVTVTVKGGHGVVGVFLVDTDLRFQARPVQGDGWVIVGAPKVWGGATARSRRSGSIAGPPASRRTSTVFSSSIRRRTSPPRSSPRARSSGP